MPDDTPKLVLREILPFTRKYDLPENFEFALSHAQLAYLHNMRVDAIEDKVSMTLDPERALEYALRDAELMSRIQTLSDLINTQE